MSSELSSPFAARVSLATDPMPREWQNFFNNLFTRVGGNSALTNLELAELIEDLSYKSYCFVHKDGTNQSITAGSETLLTWTVADYDTQSEVDLTNNKWVCGKAGAYTIKCNVTFAIGADGDRIFVALYKNLALSQMARGTAGGVGFESLQVIADLYLSKGDEILFTVINYDNNDTISGDAYFTNFSIYRLGD